MTFVELSDITYRYSHANGNVIENFSMRIDKGETVGVLGQSGCGKSTLLRLIAGLEAPTSGSITINSVMMVDSRHFILPERRGVGMVFQDYALFPHLTVEQNILFGLHRLRRKERVVRMGEMLELVQLQDYGKRFPHELSGGQQQRAAFARALAPKPDLLLMDEPFSNLDADLKSSIRGQLKEILEQAEITSMLVTHDREDADAICDRVLQMSARSQEKQLLDRFSLIE